MSKKIIIKKIMNFFYKEIVLKLPQKLAKDKHIKPFEDLENCLLKRSLAFKSKTVLNSYYTNLLKLEACHEK